MACGFGLTKYYTGSRGSAFLNQAKNYETSSEIPFNKEKSHSKNNVGEFASKKPSIG